jgi:hypothetical protein
MKNLSEDLSRRSFIGIALAGIVDSEAGIETYYFLISSQRAL